MAVRPNRAVSRVGRRDEQPFRARSKSRSPRVGLPPRPDAAPPAGAPPSTHSVMLRVRSARTASKADAVSMSQTRWAAPEMFRQCASAGPAIWVLIRALATPTLDRPYQTARYSMRLGMNRATVSPRLMPRLVAQWAKRLAMASSWA